MRLSKSKNRCSFGFFVFFVGMLCFQGLGAMLQAPVMAILGLSVLYDVFKRRNGKLGRVEKKLIWLMLTWIVLLTVFALLSRNWAYGVSEVSVTLQTLIKISYFALMLAAYVDSLEKLFLVIKSFVFATGVMAVMIMLLTPPSLYGVETGAVTFGDVVGQQRNTIAAAMTEASFCVFILKKFNSFQFPKFFIGLFLVVLLCSGSRGGIIELALILCLSVITIKDVNKKLQYIFISFLAVLLGGVVLLNIPYLYDTYFVRFQEMIATLIGDQIQDGSSYGRSMMQVYAIEIFKHSPIYGMGLDGFECYLTKNPIFMGRKFRAVYSHCNYMELATSFGVIGLLIWYCPILTKVFQSIKAMRFSEFHRYLAVGLISVLVMDYARIPWMSYPNIFYLTVMLAMVTVANNKYPSI